MQGYNFEMPAATSEPEVTLQPAATEEPVRAVYDGNISSSILEYFAGVYTRLTHNMVNLPDYLIVRTGQYEYRMYVGHMISDGVFDGVTKLYRYYGVTSGGYSVNYNYSSSEVISPNVDISGFSGYIYSSSDSFIPNPYIEESNPTHYISLVSLAILLGLCSVALFLWIKNIWETVHEKH